MQKPIISADSHITEPPNTYIDRIDHKYKDTAPHMIHDEKLGDVFIVKDFPRPINVALAAAAGKDASELKTFGAKFDEMHKGGWDPNARMADQDRDGVAAEVIYPTVGMILCNHRDFDYKKACFDAYNLWIGEYCAAHPDRLIGTGQTAMRSVEEGISDLRKMKDLGLKGVMMPGNPALEDYDSPIYAPFYEAAIDLADAAQLSYPDQQQRQLSDARAQAQQLPVDHPRMPGHHRHVRSRRSFRASSEVESSMRRG